MIMFGVLHRVFNLASEDSEAPVRYVGLDANAYGSHMRQLAAPTNGDDGLDDDEDDDEYWEARVASLLAGEGERNADQTNGINRILTTFALNPYEILDLKFDASDRQMASTYRKRSALIHPDKCSHPNARDAYQRLQEAYETLKSNKTSLRYKYMINGIKKELLMEKERELRQGGIGSQQSSRWAVD